VRPIVSQLTILTGERPSGQVIFGKDARRCNSGRKQSRKKNRKETVGIESRQPLAAGSHDTRILVVKEPLI
jgi:hypothetical protein